MRLFYICILLLTSILTLNSQSTLPDNYAESCGTDGHHQYLMKTDPDYKAAYDKSKARLDALKYSFPDRNNRVVPVDTIPVVVHVIHLGESIGHQNNISDEQIFGAIQGLNERYSNLNEQGVDIEIFFRLATTDPNGCPTSGIQRVDGSVIEGYAEEGITWDGSCGVDERPVKDLSKWPTSLYYNIWVVNDICGSIAGYAYYPNGNAYDGAVMGQAYMKYDDGTLAHELGHGLSIRHTFDGDDENTCPFNFDCLDDGDEICDTPPHRTGDCGNINPCTTEGEWNNSRYNWMSYCFASPEEGRFTFDQRTRMWNTLSEEPRASLLTSYGLDHELNLQITSDGSILCPHEPRLLTAQPDGGHFEIVEGSGVIHGDTLIATGGNEILIAYVFEDEFCTSSVEQNITVKPAPSILLRSEADSICSGGFTILEGLPSGGTFSILSGVGQVNSDTLLSLDTGLITVLYERLFSGCVLRDTHIVSALTAPEVIIEPLTETDLIAVTNASTYQWVICDEGYLPIEGETSEIFTATASGTYAVIAGVGDCRDTSACFTVNLTSIYNVNSPLSLKVYPNPVNDLLVVEGDDESSTIRITDSKGQLIDATIKQNGLKFEIDFRALPAGIYTVQVFTADGSKIRIGKAVKF